MSWIYRLGDVEHGPVTEDNLIDLFRSDQINSGTRIREDDSSIWHPLEASDIGEKLGLRQKQVRNDGGLILTIEPERVQSPGWRWSYFRIVLILYIIVSGSAALCTTGAFIANFIQPFSAEDFAGQSTRALWLLSSNWTTSVRLLSMPFCAVGFILFFHRAMMNIRYLGARRATMSPTETWGWFFVPFAACFLPMKAIGQVWSGTWELSAEESPGHFVVELWWACWLGQSACLAAFFFAQRSLMYHREPFAHPVEFQIFFGLSAGGGVFLFAAALQLYAIAAKIAAKHIQLKAISQVGAFD